MRIAIDLDGVVIDTMGAVLRQFHPEYKLEQIKTYWINDSIAGLTKEKAILEFEHINWMELTFIGEKTWDILQELEYMNEKGHMIYFLTSKTPRMMLWTQKFLKDVKINIPIITSLKKQEYTDQFDILIEDNPSVIEYGIPIEKLRFIKQPWNECLEEKGIKRYNEISEVINELNLSNE